MTWLGVGNVEGLVLSADPSAFNRRVSRAWERRPRARVAKCENRDLDFRPGDVLILATDGIEAAFADSLDISGSAQAISERILAVHWKPTDDALVLAVRYLGARR